MSASPQTPATHRGHRKRRRRRQGLKAVPVVVWIALAGCLMAVLAIPIISYQGWRWKGSFGSNAVNQGARGAVVSEAAVDTTCNCIRGIVSNGSNQAFNEVHLLFQLNASDGKDLGTVVALVSQLQPHRNLKFATDSLPPGAVRFEVKQITTPQ